MSNYDLKTKLGQYQRLASLRQMLFVDSEEVCVQIYWRGDGEVWPGAPILYAEWSDTVELPALGIAMSLETIYEDVDFSLVGG